MSAAYTDLPSPAPSPVQIGAKQISYPFQGQGDYYARIIKRNMVQTPAANWAPIIGTPTSYTNLLTYSEDFSNAAWTKNDSVFTANSVANPADGLVTCGKLLENATTAVHSVSRTLTLTAAPSNVSIIAKPISRNYIQLAFVDSAAATFSGFFNLATGAAGTLSAGVTANIIPLANSFYRASIHFTPAAGAGTVKAQISTDGATTSYAGDAAKGLYLWGAQALTGTSPGAYVSTAANTRAVSAPPVDSTAAGTIEDPFAYLIKETDPEPGPLDLGTAQWQRMAARVPADVVSGGSRVITKPAPSSFGTLSQNFADNTGAFVSAGYLYSTYYFGNNETFGPRQACTSANSAGNTRVTCTGHGVAGTERILANNPAFSQNYLFASGQYTVVDANTIDLLGINLNTNVVYLAEKLRDYTPGTDRVLTQNTQRFYLPGVTSGITTFSDIPAPAILLNDLEFIATVIANTSGYVTYDATELTRWMDSAIYTQTFEAINMSNV
jgi:hypothetical protein